MQLPLDSNIGTILLSLLNDHEHIISSPCAFKSILNSASELSVIFICYFVIAMVTNLVLV